MVNVEKEYLEYLEGQNNKLINLEHMIQDLQMNSNDRPEEVRLNYEDLKMEVFKLWYYMTFTKVYGGEE